METTTYILAAIVWAVIAFRLIGLLACSREEMPFFVVVCLLWPVSLSLMLAGTAVQFVYALVRNQ